MIQASFFRYRVLCMLLFSVVSVGIFLSGAGEALAQQDNYNLLSGIGGITEINTGGDFSALFNVVYKLSIGLGAAVAVLVIIFSALKYMTTDAFSQKSELRERIIGALGGLLMLIAAVALLNIINPEITKLNVSAFKAPGSISIPDQVSVGDDGSDEDGDDSGQPSDGGGDWSDYSLYNPVLDSSLHDTTDRSVENDPIGTIYDQPAGGGWVANARDPASQVAYATQAECESAKNDGEGCVRNPDVATPSTGVPGTSSQILTMTPANDNYDKILLPAHAARIGWPANPYRRPVDFASKGDKTVRISRTAVEMDRYYLDRFKAKFGIKLRLVSAYRDPAHNAAVGSSANNHQLGFSLDYGTKELSQAQLNFLQDLILTTNVVRVGWGRTNNAGTHVQWDDGKNQKWVYWCYQKGTGPHKGPNTMPKKWIKGSSCNW